MITMTIGEKIKARRKELGLTTEELGRMIGVQRSAITKYEKNRVDLKSRQINQIAEALQINPALLLSDEDIAYNSDDDYIITMYNSLSAAGKDYVQQQLRVAQVMFSEQSTRYNKDD